MHAPDASESGLFEAILGAPDRDHCPGQRPVVSFRDDDDPEFLAQVARRATARLELERRGVWHGQWAELDEASAPPATMPAETLLAARWHEARPILLRGLVAPRQDYGAEIGARRRLFDELREAGGLRRFVKARREALEPSFRLRGRPGRLADPERDLERVLLSWSPDHDDPTAPRVQDLWAKSAWLSTHERDASMRVRLSFGREVDDDASRDPRRHRRVTELAEILFPECALVHGHDALRTRLERWIGGEVFFTQHIAYWNAPEGGALFHHDAFDEDALGGQLGVCYVQLAGRTAWLALSIEDLARRVIEFGEYLAEGELAWVRRALFRRDDQFERFQRMLGRFKRVQRELARPGCGNLARLVNRGPEFTSLLADAGHALVLREGDVLLLPNHGLERTAMHSVFCADDEPGYALSMAIRALHPPPPEEPDEVHRAHPRGRPRGAPRSGRGGNGR